MLLGKWKFQENRLIEHSVILKSIEACAVGQSPPSHVQISGANV